MRGNTSLSFLLSMLLMLAGYLGYFVYAHQIPCVKPISYALTEYDSRFALPRSEIMSDLKKAAAVWNTQLGFQALVVSSTTTADLPVSFVFDSTQQTVDSIAAIGMDIDTAKEQLTQVANEYGTLKKQYEAAGERGQATKEMYDQLQVLYARYEVLRKQINADVAKGEDLPSGQVEEGLYTSDKAGTQIRIFAFQDEQELLRTLTHEFGHALGMNHVTNAASIMYPTNGDNESLALTKEDKAELARACDDSRNSFSGVLYIYSNKILNYGTNAMHALRLN